MYVRSLRSHLPVRHVDDARNRQPCTSSAVHTAGAPRNDHRIRRANSRGPVGRCRRGAWAVYDPNVEAPQRTVVKDSSAARGSECKPHTNQPLCRACDASSRRAAKKTCDAQWTDGSKGGLRFPSQKAPGARQTHRQDTHGRGQAQGRSRQEEQGRSKAGDANPARPKYSRPQHAWRQGSANHGAQGQIWDVGPPLSCRGLRACGQVGPGWARSLTRWDGKSGGVQAGRGCAVPKQDDCCTMVLLTCCRC